MLRHKYSDRVFIFPNKAQFSETNMIFLPKWQNVDFLLLIFCWGKMSIFEADYDSPLCRMLRRGQEVQVCYRNVDQAHGGYHFVHGRERFLY